MVVKGARMLKSSGFKGFWIQSEESCVIYGMSDGHRKGKFRRMKIIDLEHIGERIAREVH